MVVGLALAVSPAFSLPAFAQTETAADAVQQGDAALASAIRKNARGSVGAFYAGRGFRPLWVDKGLVGPQAQAFLRILDDAALDGLKPSRYKADRLRMAVARADAGGVDDLARADLALSDAFARYVRDVRRVKRPAIEFADPAMIPERPDSGRVLRVAGLAESFPAHIASMGWMSPLYARTRELLRAGLAQRLDRAIIDTIRLNMERARILPPPTVRHILVDAASAQLWYYQAGKQAGAMKVVVGAKETQTPMLAGALNYAVLNPYWNVPDYLVRTNVAKKMLEGRTLASMHMEVLSDWSTSATKLDPATVDWAAVAAGSVPMPRVRELPWKYNSMGAVKFVFPNDHGIYLHDTPHRELFAQEDRHLSNGCIRLEKAWVLGEWMMGKTLTQQAKKAGAERPLPMSPSVPVYLTYITVAPSRDGGVTLLPDIYGRDKRK